MRNARWIILVCLCCIASIVFTVPTSISEWPRIREACHICYRRQIEIVIVGGRAMVATVAVAVTASLKGTSLTAMTTTTKTSLIKTDGRRTKVIHSGRVMTIMIIITELQEQLNSNAATRAHQSRLSTYVLINILPDKQSGLREMMMFMC